MDEELQGSGAVGGGPTGDDPAADDGSRAGPAVPPPAPIPTVMAPTVMAPTGAAGPPRRSRFALVTAAAVLVVAAVVGIVVGTSGGSHGTPAPGRAPGAAVLDAIDSTLGAKTAALHLSMVMDVPGAGQITATGDGQIDFSSDSSQLTVGYQGIPTLGTTKMTEIYTGGSMYLSMPQITTQLPATSRMTSSSYSFHPAIDFSTRISPMGDASMPSAARRRKSMSLSEMPVPAPPRMKLGRMMMGQPMSWAMSSASSTECAKPDWGTARPMSACTGTISTRPSRS